MSNSLLDTLETRVSTAVDTIESLRTEINDLREERKILEDKLEEIIQRMSGLDRSAPVDEMSREEEDSESSDNPIIQPASPFGNHHSDY